MIRFVFLFIISLPMQAQEFLTFADCLERTMKNSPQLRSAEFDEKIAVANHRYAFGAVLPNVFGEVENRNSWGKEIDSETNIFVNDNIRNTEATMNAYFNLFSGFSVYNSIRVAKQEKDIVRADIRALENAVTIDLAQRYITILYLQDIISANEQQIESSTKQLEIAELKYGSGAISESEVFKVKAQKASEELMLLTSRNRLTDNLISLKQLMGMPLETEVALTKPEMQLENTVLSEEDPVMMARKAVEIHPAFQSSMMQQKLARTKLSLARAARYPNLQMRLMYRTNYTHTIEAVDFEDQIDGNASRQIRFYLTIPIFSRFGAQREIKTSKLQWKQSRIKTEMEQNRLSKEVIMAIANARTSLKKNEASTSAFAFSERSFDADALKFEMGKININELNTSKIIFNNNQAALIQSRYELLFNNALIRFYMGEPFSL